MFISSVQCTIVHCDDFVRSYLRFSAQQFTVTTLYVHIFGKGSVHIVAIYDQARSYIIKLRNWLNSFSTLYVHIFGSVHAMPMKTYCIIPPFDSVKQYQLILTIVLVIYLFIYLFSFAN
jgi:hypothetical protein